MLNSRMYLPAFAALLFCVGTANAQDSRVPLTGKELIAKDQTELANAKTDLTRAKNAYAAGLTNKRQEFLRSTEYKEAQQAAAAATAKTNQERTRVVAALEASDAYKEAVAKDKAAQAKVESLRQKKASPAEISAAATAAMVAGAPVTTMERKALEGDKDYQAANDAMIAANKEAAKLKDAFDSGLPRDPAILALKKAQDDAEIAVQKAQNKLTADQEAQKK